MWKQAWWLVGKELKFQLRAFIATIIATIIIAFAAFSVLLPLLTNSNGFEDLLTLNRFVVDMIFFGLAPSFAAIFMASPYLSLSTIKEDPFGKRMAVYRVLPIPLEVLSRSRMLLMLVTLTTLTLVFYTTMIIVIFQISDSVPSIASILKFIFVWFGYALVAGSFNIFIEFGTNGKVLWIYPFVYLFFCIVLMTLMYRHADMGIMEWSLALIDNYGWMAAAISLLLGMAGCYGMGHLLKNRLLHKDYV